MADATYDALIIGGGAKGLVTACYLAKFGGMKVAVFDRRHELGGGLASNESPASGFVADNHASTLSKGWYYNLFEQDFPDFAEKGGKFAHYPGAVGMICQEDDSCCVIYHHEVDPTGQRTAQAISKFAGEEDAETYLKLYKIIAPGVGLDGAFVEQMHSLPPPPGQPGPIEKWLRSYLAEPDCLVDARWPGMSAWQAMNDLWTSKAMVYMFMRLVKSRAIAAEQGGAIGALLSVETDRCYAVGGTHSIAHAYQRILLENGGTFFTNSEVDRVIIENGKAAGIRLVDGAQVRARKLVVSSLNPMQLCLQLIGKEHLGARICRKIENLQTTHTGTVTWYTWAVHDPPKYKSAAFNPDINDAHWIILGSQNADYMLNEAYWRYLGKEPQGDEGLAVWGHHSKFDGTRAPDGKHTVQIEEDVLPASALSEREWMDFKRRHAEKQIRVMQKYAPNFSWDNVIGYNPDTPYDTATREKNMGPSGNALVLDSIPGQTYPFRPIPELATHRTPIKNLYATGVAWGIGGGAGAGQGYTCYKAIAQDLGLAEPWKAKGRPY